VRTDWRLDALCGQVGGELFFVTKGGDTNPAKRVCSMCPVRAECLADSLLDDVADDGVYGGVSQQARRRLRRRVQAGADAYDVALVHVYMETHPQAAAS
jgi:WhiB family transcriptional regulator, redox-sensing transcriptional regulator